MKKIIVLIIMFMVASIAIMPSYPCQDFENHTKITDFGEFLIGETSGSSDGGNFTFEKEQGTFEIDGDGEPGGDKYLLVCRDGSTRAMGWLNLSNPQRGFYIDYLPVAPTNSHAYIHYIFYNEAGEKVVQFKTYQSKAYAEAKYTVQYYRLGSWSDLKPQGAVQPLRISWQHYTDNVIQYKVWRSDGSGGYSLYNTVNDTGFISGAEYSSPEQFNVKSVEVVQSSSFSGNSRQKIREFGVVSEDLEYIPDDPDPIDNPFENSTFFFSIDDLNNLVYMSMFQEQFLETRFETYYTGNITYAGIMVYDQLGFISNSLTDYRLKINGHSMGFPDMFYPLYDGTLILWKDFDIYIDNQRPLFEFRCDASVEIGEKTIYWWDVGVNQAPEAYVTSKKHNSPALWNGALDGNNHNLDFAVAWGTHEKTTQDYLDEYSDGSEKSFIEFYEYDYDCRYTKGGYFQYIAYLNSSNIINDYVSVVIQRHVYNSWTSAQSEIYYFGIEKSKFDDVIISVIPYPEIPYTGMYRFRLYDGDPYSNELLHTSVPITVCDKKETYRDYPDVDDPYIDDPYEEEIDDIFGISWENMTILIGIALVLVGLVFPNILISEHFLNIKNINLPKEVNIISGIAFLIIAIILGFLPLWIAYVFALAVVAYIVYLIKSMGYGFNGGVNGD